jgi:hypothetical protein
MSLIAVAQGGFYHGHVKNELPYVHTDLGIVKYHFEVAAGKENFEWINCNID